jgi:hypothetical protein
MMKVNMSVFLIDEKQKGRMKKRKRKKRNGSGGGGVICRLPQATKVKETISETGRPN